MPAPADPLLRRRQFLQLGLGASALLALPGCRTDGARELLGAAGELPASWLRDLPRGWRSRSLPDPAAVLARLQPGAPGPVPALVGLGDGWASTQPPTHWRPLEAAPLLERLAAWAAPVSRLFAAPAQPAFAFPWAYSPWVLALRSRGALAARGAEGWSLLLDPSLRGRLVLPSSPRVCIELMGRDFERIQALRRQALAHDDRHGLNLLLSGKAQAAVLPLRRLLPLLRRDQRLAVVLPEGGAPLGWQLLLRPAGSAAAAPLDWMAAALEAPLLPALLQGGWVPPLPRAVLEPLVRRFPQPIAGLLLPPEAWLDRCWSLPPLNTAERLALQTVWDAAAPDRPA